MANPIDPTTSVSPDFIQRINDSMNSGQVGGASGAGLFADYLKSQGLGGNSAVDRMIRGTGGAATGGTQSTTSAQTRAATPGSGPVAGGPPNPNNTVNVGGVDYTPVEDTHELGRSASGKPRTVRQVGKAIDTAEAKGDTAAAEALRSQYNLGVIGTGADGKKKYGVRAAAPASSEASPDGSSRLTSAALTGGGVLAGLSMFSMGGGSGPVGTVAGLGSMGAMATAATGASLLGMNGMAFQINKVVRSVASSYSDTQFIGMLHSGLNIETLLYYFMAYASDKYDKKLREKMEEWTLAQQAQDTMERNKSIASTLSGILSIAGPAGAAAGQVITAGADAYNRYSTALDGNMKSSTVLMQEVQILIQQWKTVNDLVSNLSKDINDMAMTTIRNLR